MFFLLVFLFFFSLLVSILKLPLSCRQMVYVEHDQAISISFGSAKSPCALSLEKQSLRGKAWNPMNWCNTETLYAYPKLGPGFPTPHVVVFFVFSELRLELVDRFC